MPKLGINIDHVATLRQARREFEPDPIAAARIALASGADSIVCHLREDRRHVQDQDVKMLRKLRKCVLNLEMAIDPSIVQIARRIKPDWATLVPEKRVEITTEGGLDVIKNFATLKDAIRKLSSKGIKVSIFIDPVKSQIEKAIETGAHAIELHTGKYAQTKTAESRRHELNKLKAMTKYADSLGFIVNAGHGLNYRNTKAVARIPKINELNIGHSVISHAVFVGLPKAVREMKRLAK